MDMSDYAIGILAEQRLRDARLAAARRQLVARHRRPRPRYRRRAIAFTGMLLVFPGMRSSIDWTHSQEG